jgi:putative restriction endonuclease
MCGKIDCYLQSFSKLRTDKSSKRWSADTCSRAPHKPLLLLSILDLIASGSITKNFIEPSFELAETFNSYWSKVMPIGISASMSYPFYHLETADFWHLKAQSDIPHQRGRTVSSVKRLKELYFGACFDDDLFPLLIMESSREKLRDTLITNYFAERVQPALKEQASVNRDASRYGADLLTTADASPVYTFDDKKDEKIFSRVRSQGFRKAIVNLYEHRCALCGIRMLTPEGHTIVEAAHIVPWSTSQDDRPQNGLALCRLCHWSFDEGLMGIGDEYEVLISKTVRQDNNFPGHMETLSGRGIFRPKSSSYWPDMGSIKKHRKKIFRLR